MQKLPSLLGLARKAAGFTMIELLIVITILGILAVAVLSAINPLEQINRGRDTARQGDAEQLLSALERFSAFQERFPWEAAGTPEAPATALGYTGTPVTQGATAFVPADSTWSSTIATCSVIDLLGPTNGVCTGSDEVKAAFVTKIEGAGDRNRLFVHKATAASTDNLYICFYPQSSAFRQEAIDRCGATGAGLPADFPFGACGTGTGPGAITPHTDVTLFMSCLP